MRNTEISYSGAIIQGVVQLKKAMVLTVIAALLAGLLSSTSAYNGKLLNGRAVSVHFRTGGTGSCVTGSPWRGSVVLYTIANSKVARADTIHSSTQGFAHYAAFNLAGTKIAFYRFGQAPATTGSGCVSVNGGKSFISMINPDGSGLTDLCELPASPANTEIFPLDWPAGDWIYYTRPHDAAHSYNGNNGSTVIWRVNAITKANEKVCNFTDNGTGVEEICNSIRRFTLSLDGKHMALMYVASGKGGCTADVINNHVNNIHPFPPPNCAIVSSCIGYRDGCNISISPSGKIVANYFAGWHDDMQLGTVNYANTKCISIENDDPSVGLPVSSDDCGHVWINPNTNTGCPMCIESSKGNLTKWSGEYIGQGAELIRWSANSDKWVMQKIGNYKDGHAGYNNQSSNQVVVNFVDSVAINISKNPVPPHNLPDDPEFAPFGTVFYNNDAGDLWVDDPVNNADKNKYEDLKGAWNLVPGAAMQQSERRFQHRSGQGVVTNIQTGGSSSFLIHIAQQGAWNVTVTAVDGRTIRSLAGERAGDVAVDEPGIARGIRVITLTQGGKRFVNRCVVR